MKFYPGKCHRTSLMISQHCSPKRVSSYSVTSPRWVSKCRKKQKIVGVTFKKITILICWHSTPCIVFAKFGKMSYLRSVYQRLSTRTPLLTHWSCCSFALNHRQSYDDTCFTKMCPKPFGSVLTSNLHFVLKENWFFFHVVRYFERYNDNEYS